MPLSQKQKRHLKGLAHSLKPVVMVGQSGLSEGMLNEFVIALDHHELIKVKVAAGDRELRDSMIAQMQQSSGGAELVQRVGNMAVFYRHNPKKKKPMELPQA